MNYTVRNCHYAVYCEQQNNNKGLCTSCSPPFYLTGWIKRYLEEKREHVLVSSGDALYSKYIPVTHNMKFKGKGKVHPIRDHEDPDGK